jgi:hypothetical protein
VRDELLGFVKLELGGVVFLELEEGLEIVGRGFTVGGGGFLGGVLEVVFLKISCSPPAVVFVELKEVLEVVRCGFTVGGGGFLGGVLEVVFEGFSPVVRFV